KGQEEVRVVQPSCNRVSTVQECSNENPEDQEQETRYQDRFANSGVPAKHGEDRFKTHTVHSFWLSTIMAWVPHTDNPPLDLGPSQSPAQSPQGPWWARERPWSGRMASGIRTRNGTHARLGIFNATLPLRYRERLGIFNAILPLCYRDDATRWSMALAIGL